jgi:O-antigen/teichoic acid export membrane protein
LLLIGILFTKSYLTTSEIGIYESLIFIASALTFFWISGITQSLLAVYKKPANGERSDAFFNSFLLLGFFSLMAFVILRIFISQFTDYFNLTGNLELVKLISIYLLFISPAYLIEYIYLLKDQPKKIIFYGLISYTLQLVLVVLPIFLEFPLIMAVRGLVIISVLRFIWLISMVFTYSSITFNLVFLKEHLVIGLPLILGALLSGAGVYIDGLIITHYFDQETFAVFRYGAKEFPLFLLLANAFSNSMIPEINSIAKLEGGLKKIKNKSLKMIHYLFPVAMVLVVISHWFYPVVFNKSFSESASVFNIYLLLIISRMVFPQTIVIGLKKTKMVFYFSFIEIIINVTVSLLLINKFGILGVAFGTVVAHFFEKLLLVIYCKAKLNISISKYIPVFAFTVYSAVLVVFFIIIEII